MREGGGSEREREGWGRLAPERERGGTLERERDGTSEREREPERGEVTRGEVTRGEVVRSGDEGPLYNSIDDPVYKERERKQKREGKIRNKY